MNMQAPKIHPDHKVTLPYEEGDLDIECTFDCQLHESDVPGAVFPSIFWAADLVSVRIERAHVKPEDVFTEAQIEALERQAVEACG